MCSACASSDSSAVSQRHVASARTSPRIQLEGRTPPTSFAWQYDHQRGLDRDAAHAFHAVNRAELTFALGGCLVILLVWHQNKNNDWARLPWRGRVPTLEDQGWASQLYTSIKPQCTGVGRKLADSTRPYDGPLLPRTVLITYPRSGNTYSRQLVERATGFRTSSVYCDRALERTFVGECEQGPSKWFLRKSHYPALLSVLFRFTHCLGTYVCLHSGRVSDPTAELSEVDFDQGIQIGTPRLVKSSIAADFASPVRNPLDAIYSYWQWRNAEDRGATGQALHEDHVDVDRLGKTSRQMRDLKELAEGWRVTISTCLQGVKL